MPNNALMNTVAAISSNTFLLIVSLLYLITAVFLCLVIIFENRSPVKTLAWVLVVILVPVIGIVLYLMFGQYYRKNKIFSRKGLTDTNFLARAAVQQIVSLKERLRDKSAAVKSKSHLIRLMINNEKTVLTEKNSVDLLINASQAFPAMIEAIERAKEFIHLEFYRFDIDDTGNSFRYALMKKAREGVEVRIIMDDVGSWSFKRKYIREMRDAGVRIFPFLPVRFPFVTTKLNYRNHRKILVVDGVEGYMGGLNIADKYIHGHSEIGPWRDTHIRILGEAVAALNMVFLTDWFFVCGELLTTEPGYLRQEPVDNNCWIQIAESGPDSDWAAIMQVYFSAIATANECIYLSTPYFSPNESILTALKTAALSGVDVRLILPDKSDSVIGSWNSRSYIEELLDSGVRIYLYKTGFNHAKYILVDNVFASVGSVNVDIRSFDMNFEVTALIYDEEFAARLHDSFIEDIKNSSEVIPEFWKGRRRSERHRESLARVFGPLY
jgi:cardiolipin synthase